MKQYPTPQSQHPAAEDSPLPSKPRRRLLLKASLGAAPTVMLLHATPVLAANCKSPSGFSVSGNLSRNGGTACPIQLGRTPSFWAANLSGNGAYVGSGQLKPSTLFSERFPALHGYPDASFGTILGASNTGDQALFVAVYLESVLHTDDGFPTRAMIKDMWQGVGTGAGYAVPNTSIVWSKASILKYLLYLTGQSPG